MSNLLDGSVEKPPAPAGIDLMHHVIHAFSVPYVHYLLLENMQDCQSNSNLFIQS